MPNVITINRGDGTSFTGVTDGTITQEGSGPAATIVFVGVGWLYVAGTGPSLRNGAANASAAGSRILLQNFAATGGQPSTSRFTLVESSGGGYVMALGGSTEYEFSEGQYIDVIHSNPPVINSPQTYVPNNMPETASAMAEAEEAMEAALP